MMNTSLLVLGIIEITISLLTGFFVFFVGLKFFMLLTRKVNEKEELQKNNVAVAVVLLAFMLALILIVRSAISPAMDTLRILFEKESLDIQQILVAVARIVVTYLVSALIALMVLWLAVVLYTALTKKINEMEELKKNNLAIGLLLATFLISAGLIILEPLTTLLNAFVAAPEVFNTQLAAPFINTRILLQGLIELPLAFLGAILIFLMGFKMSDLLSRNINETGELEKNNVAIAIFTAASVFSVMLLVKASLTPAYKVLGGIFSAKEIDLNLVLTSSVRIVLFFLGSAVIAFLLVRLAVFSFMFFTTKMDEMLAIRQNNVAIALIIAVLAISIVILVEPGMTSLLNSFVEMPQLGKGFPVIRIK
jgi:uncharacterized membrane protein YjfL (UPF0719 family)